MTILRPVLQRLRQWSFWLITLLLTAAVLGVHQWQPFPVSWPVGMFLHHITLFGALYLGLRWWFEAHLAFSAALGVCVLPLVFTGAPLGQYSLALVGEFSLLTAFSITLITLADYRWRHRVTPLFPVWFWGLMLPVAVVATLGQWVHMDIFPYFHGDNAGWLAVAAAALVLGLCLTGWYWAAVLVAGMSLGYDWRLLDSHNAWDYLADAGWLLVTLPLLWWRWTHRPAQKNPADRASN